MTELWTYGDMHTARGEVYEPAKRARKALQGPGVVGSYSSGERGSGLVYPGYGRNVGIARAQPMVYPEIYMPECA